MLQGIKSGKTNYLSVEKKNATCIFHMYAKSIDAVRVNRLADKCFKVMTL